MRTSVSRRAVLTGIVAAAISSLPLPGIIRGARAATGELVISSWGGTFQDALREAFFTPFAEETGVKIVEQTYGGDGLAKLKAQAQAGKVAVDLLDGPPFWATLGKEGGLLAPIPYDGFPDRADQMAAAMDGYSYGYGTTSWGIGYNTDGFPNGGPKSWADFWDTEAFAGDRSMFGAIPARHLEYALMADGVAAQDVNPLDPAKVDRAFAKLAAIKPSVGVWYTSLGQAQSLLLSREVDMAEFVNGRAFEAQDKGQPIGFSYDGAVMNVLIWVMAKNAPNPENALKFLQFCGRADRQAALARSQFSGPTNARALELITDRKTLSRMPTYPENLKKQVMLDGAFWANNLGKLRARWLEVTSG